MVFRKFRNRNQYKQKIGQAENEQPAFPST